MEEFERIQHRYLYSILEQHYMPGVGGQLTDNFQDSILDSNSLPSDNAQHSIKVSSFLITTLAWTIHDQHGLRSSSMKPWCTLPTNTRSLRRRRDRGCILQRLRSSSPSISIRLAPLLHVERGWRPTHKPPRSSRPRSRIHPYAITTSIPHAVFDALLRCPTPSMQAEV